MVTWCGVVCTIWYRIGNAGLKIACLERELLHFLAHHSQGVDQGAKEREYCAVGKGDITYLDEG